MNNYLRGWKTVFRFTFQKNNGKGYKAVTALIALVLIGVLVLVNILVAKPDEEEKSSPISQVFILDESGLETTDFAMMMQQVAPNRYPDTNYKSITNTTVKDALQTLENETTAGVLVHITTTETGYQLEGLIPSSSTISTGDCDTLLQDMTMCFESNKMMQAGLTMEQLTTALAPVQTTYQSVGEDTNIVTILIKMLVPMIFGFMMYMMLLLHGQTVSKSVSSEKTTKLMETLLTSIHPYALITGKVLAISASAILQFIIWVFATVVGFFGGNAIAHAMYPEYENTVITIINFVRDNIGESALTLSSVIIAVLIFCIGFLFYCVLASLAGCMVSKPEDIASAQGIFVFPIIISWLVCYIASAADNTAVLSVARYIPFTIPFSVPVDLLTGTVGIGQGILALFILLLFSAFVIIVAAKLFKGLILYTGEKVSFKKMVHIFKSK